MHIDLKKINFLGIKSGREWLILLACLLFAFCVWLINALSETYSYYFRYKIVAETSLEGRSNMAESEDIVVVSGDATGFAIANSELFNTVARLKMTIDPKYMHQYGDHPDVFFVLGNDVFSDFTIAAKDRVAAKAILTDTIFFVYPKQAYKKVPVIIDDDFGYASQYMPTERVNVSPDSVIIYGDESLLAGIDSVFTEKVSIDGLSKRIQGVCSLLPVKGVRFSEDEIFFSQPVVRYVEHSVKVELVTANVPDGKDMILLPNEITVTFRQPFSLRKEFSGDDFVYAVDYNDYLSSMSTYVSPVPVSLPESLYGIEITPSFVDCIVR